MTVFINVADDVLIVSTLTVNSCTKFPSVQEHNTRNHVPFLRFLLIPSFKERVIIFGTINKKN